MNSIIFPIDRPVIVVVGPTAIGKTALSLKISGRYDCEIVSLDSMQVYRYMDIGTAKASPEEQKRVVHHLIDVVNPDEHYDADQFVTDALEAIHDIHCRGKIPLVTGGTGLYLRALTEGFFDVKIDNPELRQKLYEKLEKEGRSKLHEELSLCDSKMADKIHTNDTHRLIRGLEIYHSTGKSWSQHIDEQLAGSKEERFTKILQIGLTCDREVLYERINKRTQMMLRAGLRDEVEKLLKMGYGRELKPMQAIGYRHMIGHLLDYWTVEETERLLARDTRRYAKRQYTWFRKSDIEWFDVDSEELILKRIDAFQDDHSLV